MTCVSDASAQREDAKQPSPQGGSATERSSGTPMTPIPWAYGPFVENLDTEIRIARLDRMVRAMPPVNTKALEIVQAWFRVARKQWCEHSKHGLYEAIDDLPTRDRRGLLSRYQLLEAAEAERVKARQGRAA